MQAPRGVEDLSSHRTRRHERNNLRSYATGGSARPAKFLAPKPTQTNFGDQAVNTCVSVAISSSASGGPGPSND